VDTSKARVTLTKHKVTVLSSRGKKATETTQWRVELPSGDVILDTGYGSDQLISLADVHTAKALALGWNLALRYMETGSIPPPDAEHARLLLGLELAGKTPCPRCEGWEDEDCDVCHGAGGHRAGWPNAVISPSPAPTIVATQAHGPDVGAGELRIGEQQ
jgi:hypothetical protein